MCLVLYIASMPLTVTSALHLCCLFCLPALRRRSCRGNEDCLFWDAANLGLGAGQVDEVDDGVTLTEEVSQAPRR